MIRLATHADTRQLIEFTEKFHREQSLFKDVVFDRPSMVSYIDYHIGTAKHVVYVNDVKDEIVGFILGGLEPFPFNKKVMWASDGMFIADRGGASLLKRFHAWAFANKAHTIFQAVSTGDSRADTLYNAMGMKQTGGMYAVQKDNKD